MEPATPEYDFTKWRIRRNKGNPSFWLFSFYPREEKYASKTLHRMCPKCKHILDTFYAFPRGYAREKLQCLACFHEEKKQTLNKKLERLKFSEQKALDVLIGIRRKNNELIEEKNTDEEDCAEFILLLLQLKRKVALWDFSKWRYRNFGRY